jgi:hypothetical protein
LIDVSHFKKLCYALANHVGGKLVTVSEPQETNYYCANLEINGKEIHILLNSIYPLIAIALRVEYKIITFIDDQTLTNARTPNSEGIRGEL